MDDTRLVDTARRINMNARQILARIREENLSQEDIAYLVDRLCAMTSKSNVTVTLKVIMYLKSRPYLGEVNREETARYLNMSARTLSRKLKQEQTAYHALLNEERKRRCLHYMCSGNPCGQEIVELLGMSDISHFYRSFKQWTGCSFSEAKAMVAENHRNIDRIIHRLEKQGD